MIFNLVVLIFEVLYYSLFMYYARQEGKFYKYIVIYILATLIILFVGNDTLYCYLLIFIFNLFMIKYYLKIKCSLYDGFIIFIMLLFSLFITLFSYFIFGIFIKNIFLLTLIYLIVRNFVTFLLRNIIRKYYDLLEYKWKNNNFFVRYFFTVFMFLYVIFSCIYSLIK